MGIWIRNQDKKRLIEVSCTEIVTGNEGEFDIHRGTEKSRFVGMASVIGNEMMLGVYNSEAEAMQVLDMIQEMIVHQEQVRLMPSQDWLTPSIVFQMPPAGFNQQPEKFIPGCGADLNHCELLDGTKAGVCEDYFECKAAWDRGCR